MIESRDFIPVNKFKRKSNIMSKSSRSRDSYDNYSDSIDIDEDVEETGDYSRFKARNIPCLQSICQKLRK